jgi:hypothetical protein
MRIYTMSLISLVFQINICNDNLNVYVTGNGRVAKQPFPLRDFGRPARCPILGEYNPPTACSFQYQFSRSSAPVQQGATL